MKYYILFFAMLGAFAFVSAPAYAKKDPDEILKRHDKNEDGKISKDEFRGPKFMFNRLDRNQDGFLDREELELIPQ